MYRKLFITAVLLAGCISLSAQTIAKEFKGISNGNPISSSVFCADPTALEYNGRLYVYGTNDHQQFLANGKKNGNGYGDIKSIVVFSTADMVNWTFHGTIDVGTVCSNWGRNFYRSWAPSVTWRHNEMSGKDEFFLYFANWATNVGVLTAESPLGPWKSPLSNAMITGNSPGVNPCSWCFDPGVVIDENGTGWISFGGGDPNNKGNNLMPNNAGFAKLNSDMISLDGSAIKLLAPYHFEASELNIIGGKFVYTYCSSWADRSDEEWNAYKAEKGISIAKPDKCTMCYMVSDNPMDPKSWVYKGVYGKHPGMPSPNNHSHLHKFKGNYYYIYHWGALMKAMLDANTVDSSVDGYRSICVNKATVSESSATVNPVTLNLEGCDAIDTMNPYELQQIETMATCGGIEYEDFTNIKRNTRINTLGNDASENMQVKMGVGDWTQVRKVNFGTTGASKFMLRAKGTGTLEIRAGIMFAKPSATVEFSSDDMEDYIVELDATKFQGTKNLFFLISSATDAYLDAWQFFEDGADGMQTVEHNGPVKHQSYDLAGRPLSSNRQTGGVIIEQTVDANGMKHYRKHLSGKQ